MADGTTIGWVKAYEVMVAIISPSDTTNPALAWPLSVAGWLAGPAIAGAVIGHIVSAAITAHRTESFNEIFAGPRSE